MKRPCNDFIDFLSVGFEFQPCYECGQYFELEGYAYDRKNTCRECDAHERARETWVEDCAWDWADRMRGE